jgi:hypothetical protein
MIDQVSLYSYSRLNPIRYKDSTGLVSQDEKLSQDIGAFEQRVNASDTKMSNATDNLARHTGEYQDAYARSQGPHTTEQDWDDLKRAGDRLQTDEVRLKEIISERNALRAEAQTLETRSLGSLQNAWDTEAKARNLARGVGSNSGGGFRTAGRSFNPTARPTELPAFHTVKAGKESLAGAVEMERTVLAGSRNIAKAAAVGRDLRHVVRVLNEAEAAGLAGGTARSAKLGTALKIGGTALMFYELVTTGANEAGVWDATVGGVLNLTFETSRNTYNAGKAAVRSWLSIGPSLNQQTQYYSSGK